MSENENLKTDRGETDQPPTLGRMYPEMTKEEFQKLARSAMLEFYAAETRPPLNQDPSNLENETRGDVRQLRFSFRDSD